MRVKELIEYNIENSSSFFYKRCWMIIDLSICLLALWLNSKLVEHPETNQEQLQIKSLDWYAMLAYVVQCGIHTT